MHLRPKPSHQDDHRWPVVVVGAGPAGLVSAITLARAGISVLVLNRRNAVSELPRATVLSVRTMELMRAWGLEEAITAGGDDVEWRMLLAPTLSTAALGQTVEVGFPTRAESASVSPTWPACVPQDHFERVLLEHLRTLPAARVEAGIQVIDVQPASDGNHVTVRRVSSGATSVVEAEYVLGADGAKSTVRERAGIRATETERLHESFAAVFHAPLWDVVGPHRYGIYSVEEPVQGTFLPAGHHDRWVYAFGWDPSTERLEDYPDSRIADRIRVAAGAPQLTVRITRIGAFAFSAGLADTFRSGAVFLVGDAAHRVTPRGGTGLNTAVASAYNLAWKLSWVLEGWASRSLLDTYELERRPIAEHNLARSLDPAGSRRGVGEELAVDLGGRIPHRWVATGSGVRSTLDLLAPGFTRFTTARHRQRDVDRQIPLAPPVTTQVVDSQSAAALGADGPGGLLVRPDGLVVDEATAIAAAVDLAPITSRAG